MCVASIRHGGRWAAMVSGFQTFGTTDVEESVQIGSSLFYDHRLEPARAGLDFSYRLAGFQVGAVSIGRLSYGCEVAVEMDEVEDFYGISAPSAGRLDLRIGGRELAATPERAIVAGPVGASRVSGWENPGDELTMIRVDRRVLEAELGRIINDEVTAPIDFAHALDLRGGRGAEWWAVVLALYESASRPDGLAVSPILSAQFASAVMSGLLLATEHRYREVLDRGVPRPPPPSIRRAVGFMDEHAGLPITIPDVAAAVGSSVRSLQQGFSDHLGTTPGAYLARVRLDNAHRDLALGNPETTSVSQVASRWGYHNFGRFAARYRAAYGVPPSHTLRRD